MAIPAKIPILYAEDDHTDRIGYTPDGRQFMAFATFAYSPPYAQLTPAQQAEWASYRREYVVVHLFDGEGNYVSTNSWYAGTTASCEEAQIEAQLQQMLAALGEVRYGDIAVKPFQTQREGITFGLVADEPAQQVWLLPNDLLFMEPWQGEYYT